MDTIFQSLIPMIISGGQGAIVAILVVVIVFLFIERKRLIHDIEKKENKIDKIIEDYYKGNISLTEALNSLRIIMIELKSELRNKG